MQTNVTALSILIVAVLVGGAILLTGGENTSTSEEPSIKNVSMENGTQIISISAKGGYSPRVTSAKAGIPTVIRVDTRGTFDCSSALIIPSLNISKNLPPSGKTDISIPPQEAGSTMRGLCAMGMYSFSVIYN